MPGMAPLTTGRECERVAHSSASQCSEWGPGGVRTGERVLATGKGHGNEVGGGEEEEWLRESVR